MKISNIVGLAKFMAVQRIRGFDVPKAPVFDAETQKVFSGLIASSRLYVEYGTGGSTVMASTAGLECVSVESDPFFADAVRKAIGNANNTTVLTRSIGINGPWGMPIFRKPTPRGLRHRAHYVAAPLSRLGDRVPDFVLIDGRLRLACALTMAAHAMVHGAATHILIDDYGKAGRGSYAIAERFLGPPQRQGRSALFRLDGMRSHEVIDQQDIQAALHDIT